jgi:predicted small integral membrane protein
MVMLLFGAGFVAIGGEWFLMWQSKIWNGTEAATRYFGIAAFTLVALLAGERGDDTA